MTNPTLLTCPYCELLTTKSTYNQHIEDCPTRMYIENQRSENASETPVLHNVGNGTNEDVLMMDDNGSLAVPNTDGHHTGNQGRQQLHSSPEIDFEYDYGENHHDNGTDETTSSTDHVDTTDADGDARMVADEEDDTRSIDSHVEPMPSRAIPVGSPGASDGDEDGENIETDIDDDANPHTVVDDNPRRYEFDEYPHIGQDARTRKSCELYCLVQEQNLTRDTHHALIKMLNNWMKDDELSADRQPLYSPFITENQMVNSYGVQPKLYQICPNGCRLFPIGSLDGCDCNALQFKPGTNTPI
ncbi:hypothetical protein BJV82DRAFT_679190 [Fennellomyces sp. T-0311]|nr:hypothetical protein BJV82DRAFT_679190 [Fennellomyces sp. T-0311]